MNTSQHSSTQAGPSSNAGPSTVWVQTQPIPIANGWFRSQWDVTHQSPITSRLLTHRLTVEDDGDEGRDILTGIAAFEYPVYEANTPTPYYRSGMNGSFVPSRGRFWTGRLRDRRPSFQSHPATALVNRVVRGSDSDLGPQTHSVIASVNCYGPTRELAVQGEWLGRRIRIWTTALDANDREIPGSTQSLAPRPIRISSDTESHGEARVVGVSDRLLIGRPGAVRHRGGVFSLMEEFQIEGSYSNTQPFELGGSPFSQSQGDELPRELPGQDPLAELEADVPAELPSESVPSYAAIMRGIEQMGVREPVPRRQRRPRR